MDLATPCTSALITWQPLLEAFHVTGWSREEIRESLEITLEPVTEDPLPVPDGMQPWEPWPPRLAAALFLAKLRDLAREERAIE